jgi:predicted Zn-dependent peptidase
MVDDLKSITVEDINSLAREYLQPERAIRISIVPVTE